MKKSKKVMEKLKKVKEKSWRSDEMSRYQTINKTRTFSF